LVRFRDVYLVPWKFDGDPVEIDDVSRTAFDSPAERDRVAALLGQYDATLRLTPDVDNGFATLAAERTARHPLRTYLFVPLQRIATLWLTPRTEFLPISGHLWPLAQQWQDDSLGFSVTVFLAALNFFYVGWAIAGCWNVVRHGAAVSPGTSTAVTFLVTFILLRTAFLTQVETPEPRYVLECFPALLAMGALAWLPRTGGAMPRPEARDESSPARSVESVP
jgi:hypothetical protein